MGNTYSIDYDEEFISQFSYFYSKDVQGSTTNIVDKKGECCNSYNYSLLYFTEAKNLKKVVCDKEVKLIGLSKNTQVKRK